MRHRIGALALLLALAACAPGWPGQEVADNPYHACHAAGIAYASEGFEDCLERSVAERCSAAGAPPGSPAFEGCARRFEDAILVAQALELRGYRLFGEVN